LHPDLVVGWASGNRPADIERLRQVGLPVFLTQSKHLEDIPGLIETLGRLAGTQAQARRAAGAFRTDLQALRDRYAMHARVSVFFEIWARPLVTLNGQQIVSDVLRLCGGENIFGKLSNIAPQVGREDVMRADPDVIIISEPRSVAAVDLAHWRRMDLLRAVREHHLYIVSPDLIQRPGPRILQGADLVCADLESARRSTTR